MASEATVISDHSTAPEKVEKVNEEVKEIEESLPTSKGSGEQKEPKTDESPRQPAPASSEVEEKIEEKHIEPSLAAEVKKPDDAPVLEVPVEDKSQPEAKPTIESVEEQPNEKPVIEVVEKQREAAPEVVEVTEPPIVPEQPVTEPAEKKPQEQPPVQVVEKEAEVQPKIGDTPEPLVEAVEESDKMEFLPVKESETLVAKDTDSPEEAPKKEEISEPVTKVEDKPQETSETVEVLKKECVETKPKESVEVEIAKDEETLADKIEETKKEPVVMDKPQEPSESAEKFEEKCALVEPKESVKVEIAKVEEALADKIEDPPLKEEKTDKDEVVATEKAPEQAEATEKVEEECVVVGPEESVTVEIAKFKETLVDKIEETTKVEPVVLESSDQITPTNVEAEADTKEDGSIVVTENANIVEKEKELSETDVVEVLSKEVVVESGKVELESEGKNVETQEEKKVVTEESDEPKTNKVEDVISSISPNEVAEKSLEGKISTRGIELFAGNGKESIKDDSETVTSVETEKNGEVEEKIVEATAPTVEVPAEEPKKSETEVKGEETAETGETNYVKENEAGAIAKSDFPTPEPPKEVVSTKPTSKQSNTIMSKVKQSLVKAKKAIIGKSPNSKTVSSEAKGDIKEK